MADRWCWVPPDRIAPAVSRSHDHARQRPVVGAEPCEGPQVVERTHAAAGDQRDRAGAQDRSQLPERRALEGPVAPDLGDDEGGEPDAVEAAGEVDQIGTGPFLPPADGHLVAPGVEAHRDASRELPAQLLHQRRALDRGGADHDPLDPGVEQLERRFGRPHAAPHLDPAGDAADDQADLVEVGPGAGTGGIEVHHVDPPRAGGLELARDPDRIVVVDGLRGEVALVQPHAMAVAQVDRGEQLDHGPAQSVPLVDGTPEPSTLTASRSARATPLNEASITWCPLRPESERMCSVTPAAKANASQNSSASWGSKVPIHSTTGSTS